MGTLSCDVPLYLHHMMWLGRDHAELLTHTIPLHQRFHSYHLSNSTQTRYFPLRCFTRGTEIEESSKIGWSPVHYMPPSLFTTPLQFNDCKKRGSLYCCHLTDGPHSTAGSFLIRFYQELIAWMLGSKNRRHVKQKSTNISLLMLWSLQCFW
jgi:hypothetical protein